MVLTNVFIQVGSEPRKNNLGNDFILSVAKANGYEVSKIGSIGTFENKAEVGSVHLFFLLERKVS